MTISNASNVNNYVGNASTNIYAFTFPVFNPTDLFITITSPAGVPSTLVQTVDYTVNGLITGGGMSSVGSITLVNASQAWLTAGNLSTGDVNLTLRSLPISFAAAGSASNNFNIRCLFLSTGGTALVCSCGRFGFVKVN